MKRFPILKSNRCILGQITEKDFPAFLEIINDHLTQLYLSELCSVIHCDEDIRLILKSFDSYFQNDEGVIWGIRLDNVMIGFIALMDLSCNPTIFYAMHPCFRGRGYLKECALIVVSYFFEIYPCLFLQTEVHNRNMQSISLLQSVGFNITGNDRVKTYLRKIRYT